MSRPPDLVVIDPVKDWTCTACGEEAAGGTYLLMEEPGPVCLRCADLRRSQVDHCWPRIATQLAGRPQLADLACTQATAAFAAAQALDALAWSRSAHVRPATWNASVEIDPVSTATHHRRWPPHPACPCRGVRQ